MIKEKLDSTADRIFGPDDSDEKSRWIKYWADGKHRYRYYIEQLQRILPADFSRARILDIGCGSGGLDLLLKGGCRLYTGIDFKMHVLQLTRPSRNGGYIQGNGIRLPLPDSSFDFIFAFDVLEHLKEGTPWQREFLKEIRRVLSPLGIAMLSTPNYWYPYDAHSRTSCPQFMPAFLADRYVNWRNPEFIKEHESFRNIRLIHPGRFRRLIREAGLLPLHQLPCCLDRSEYLRLHPILGILPYAGLGWLPHAEFWLILTRKEDRGQVRRKLIRNRYFREEIETAAEAPLYQASIDFTRGDFYHQLDRGWHWPEQPGDNFRWIERRAGCLLEGDAGCRNLFIEGYSPIDTRLFVYCDGLLLGIHQAESDRLFRLEYPLLSRYREKHLFSIEFRSTGKVVKDDREDPRELSVQFFAIGVTI